MDFPKGLFLITLIALPFLKFLPRVIQLGDIAAPITTQASSDATIRLAFSMVVTIFFLGASLFIILSDRYTPASTKWAFGTAGLIMGYWLHF